MILLQMLSGRSFHGWLRSCLAKRLRYARYIQVRDSQIIGGLEEQWHSSTNVLHVLTCPHSRNADQSKSADRNAIP